MDFAPTIRHAAEYDDPMITGRRSSSGKLQWQCQKCGRITSGAERECFTVEMAYAENLHPMSAPARATVQRIPQSANSPAIQGRLLTESERPVESVVRPTNPPVVLEGEVDQRENPQKAVRETRLPGSGVRPYLDRL